MKKWALGLVMLASTMSPAFALLGGADAMGDTNIKINGHPFQGTFTFVEDRIFVNVDSFGKALGLPHQHNALNWQLSESGGKGNPFQLSVESNGVKLPAVRFAGTTMVDLEKACAALKLHYHRDFQGGVFQVGAPYVQEYVVGSYHRRRNLKEGSVDGTTRCMMYGNDGASHAKWANKKK